jgi:transcription elongation factor Elf1
VATEVYRAVFITCPYCGYVHEDMCDYPWGSMFERDEDKVSIDCDVCQKNFEVELHMDTTFTTRQKEG